MSLREQSVISIVIDDLGLQSVMTKQASELDPAVTLSFLPYGNKVWRETSEAQAAGHDILLHLPMEPSDPTQDPGPNALMLDLGFKEILSRLRWAFDRIPLAIGVNNHMGSKFTADVNAMATVIGEIKARDLIYLDSRTTAKTVGSIIARQRMVKTVERDVFLDNKKTTKAILGQLEETEYIAKKNGRALAIGHAYSETLDILEQWIPIARNKGFSVLSISQYIFFD